MSAVSLILTVGVALPGVVMLAITGYLAVLAVAALRYRPPAGGPDPDGAGRVMVVIPAHNEELLIGRCVATLRNQTYPAERFGILVVADNCTDQTARVAAGAGASVLERVDATRRGKGWALQFAIETLLARAEAPRAVIIVDADGECDPRLLETLTGVMNTGALVVQAENALDGGGSHRATLRAAAFTLVNRVRPQGRAVLGLPCGLQGSGMLFSHAVLTAFPWNAYSAIEDVEYALQLREGGVGVVYTSGARVLQPAPPTLEAADVQQERWVGGKFALVRTQGPRLLRAAIRQRRAALVDAAIELAIPPLALAAAGLVAGLAVAALGVATGLTSSLPLVIWGASALLLCAFVVIGFIAGHVPRAAWRALLTAPMLVVSRVFQLRRVVAYDADSWARTPRAGESSPDDAATDPLETHR
jgi:1,2-diacylglycerol 3-beta-glucosyltransferase